jgi:hypothetical protein
MSVERSTQVSAHRSSDAPQVGSVVLLPARVVSVVDIPGSFHAARGSTVGPQVDGRQDWRCGVIGSTTDAATHPASRQIRVC